MRLSITSRIKDGVLITSGKLEKAGSSKASPHYPHAPPNRANLSSRAPSPLPPKPARNSIEPCMSRRAALATALPLYRAPSTPPSPRTLFPVATRCYRSDYSHSSKRSSYPTRADRRTPTSLQARAPRVVREGVYRVPWPGARDMATATEFYNEAELKLTNRLSESRSPYVSLSMKAS